MGSPTFSCWFLVSYGIDFGIIKPHRESDTTAVVENTKLLMYVVLSQARQSKQPEEQTRQNCCINYAALRMHQGLRDAREAVRSYCYYCEPYLVH